LNQLREEEFEKSKPSTVSVHSASALERLISLLLYDKNFVGTYYSVKM